MNRQRKGFTLLEAMVVIAIMAITMSMAYPSFKESTERAALKNAAATFEQALSRARVASIENNLPAFLCPADSIESNTCGNENQWGNGLLLFLDLNKDKKINSGESVLAYMPLADNDILVTANTLENATFNYIGFYGGGQQLVTPTGNVFKITLTSSKNSNLKKCIKVNKLGRVLSGDKC